MMNKPTVTTEQAIAENKRLKAEIERLSKELADAKAEATRLTNILNTKPPTREVK